MDDKLQDAMRVALQAVQGAAPPAPAAVPPGWKLVPIEPTRAMIASGAVALMKASHSDIDPTMEEVTAAYHAMIRAAKPATAVPLTDEQIESMHFEHMFESFHDGKVFAWKSFARAIERAHSIAAAGDKS